MGKINNIIVLGGGTSGLISALMIKSQFPQLHVKIVESSSIGIIGVGEGATEHWRYFCDFIGLPLEETLVECNATLKAGIKFTNWGVPDYYHATTEPYAQTFGDYSSVYAELIANNASSEDIIFKKRCIDNEVPQGWVDGAEPCPVNQFHFNTFSMNEYLHKVCRSRNIDFVDDIITDINLDQNGYIQSIIGEHNNYSADLFIDSSGFSKILMKKLGAKWISYKENLWVNSAIAFPTEDTDSYPTCTTAKGMDYGWMWNTPVLGRWGNGYVFCDKYINFDQAKVEVEQVLGRKIDVVKQIKFDAGRLDKFWIKNCISIGLCSSFIEPLESSAISQSILQTFLIINLVQSWINDPEGISNLYNQKVETLCQNILEFVAVHYISPREDTNFWRDLKHNREMWIPNSLKTKLLAWSKRLPLSVDFNQQFVLFNASNWIITLHGLQLLNVNNIREELKLIPSNIREQSQEIIKFNKQAETDLPHIKHKDALMLFRKNYDNFVNGIRPVLKDFE